MRKKRESYTVYETIRNTEDIRNTLGEWVKAWAEEVNGHRIMRITRSGGLWNAVKHRCLDGGAQQRAYPKYVGCTMEYSSFQDFSEWCQQQYGYRELDTKGKYWNLDKDILIQGNKVYSKETCIFVPEYVNSAFRSRPTRGLPRGVYLNRDSSTFKMACIVSGEIISKNYRTISEAHRGWQEHKMKELTRLSEERALGNMLCNAISHRVHLLSEEYDKGLISNWSE